MSFKYDEHNKYHRLARTSVITVASLATFIIIWWFVAMLAHRSAIPTPQATFAALITLFTEGDPITGLSVWTYISSSMSKFVKGFALALVVALPVGLILGSIKPLREFINPMIEILRPIAPIAWAPIFIILFGFKNGAMLVVFIGIVFPLLTNVIFGVTKMDPILTDAAKTLGASNLQIFVKILLPNTIPYLMNGIKVGLGIGWMCIVAAELYASPLGGLGFYVSSMIEHSSYPEAFAGIIIIAVLGLLTTGVAEYISKRVSRRMGMDA